MASLSSLSHGQITEFLNRLDRAGMDAEAALAVIRSTENEAAECMCRALMRHPCMLVHDLFTPAPTQIEMVRGWSREWGWGFTEKDFKTVSENVPTWPKKESAALVLVPYLGGDNSESGIERTFSALRRVAMKERNIDINCVFEEAIRLLPGAQHVPGVRWEIIDFGTPVPYWKLSEHSSSKESPHAGILAAAAIHHGWIEAMRKNHKPAVWIPGYRLGDCSGLDEFKLAPFIAVGGYESRVVLGRGSCDSCSDCLGDRRSIPTFCNK